MTPGALAFYGYSARDVCAALTNYSNSVRRLYAVDALVAAIMFGRMDTVAVLLELKTPLDVAGLSGLSVIDVALHRGITVPILLQNVCRAE